MCISIFINEVLDLDFLLRMMKFVNWLELMLEKCIIVKL